MTGVALIDGLVDRPNNEDDLWHGTASAAVRASQLDNHCCNCRSDCSDRQPRHRFLEPIHNVKDEACRLYRSEPRICGLHLLERLCCHYAAKPAVVVEPVGIEPTTSSLQS